MAEQMMTGLFKTKRGPGNMELLPAPVPIVQEDEVLIEVAAAGICGTDVHIRHDQFPYWPPVIMGHEFTGRIVELGRAVVGFQSGERVVAEPHTKACGKCSLCRTGNIQLCPEKRSPGWGINGAFARYVAMPQHLLHRVPDSMTDQEAALVEPAANVVHDVLERGRVEPEDFVVVNGCGAIGLMATMAAKAAGARAVVLVGAPTDAKTRLPVGRTVGADEVVVAGPDDPVGCVMELTHGRGADLVIEASGAAAAIDASIRMVRVLGRVVAIGLSGKDAVAVPWDVAMARVCTLIFNLSTGYTCWDRAIGLIASRRMDVAKLITHVEPLRNWELAFDAVEHQRAIKALLTPEDG